METFNTVGFIGWGVIKYRAVNQGSRSTLPNPAQNTIRIFGDMPEGTTIESIILRTGIDLDTVDFCDIIIHHPGVKATVISTNADGEKKYELSFQVPLSVTRNSSTNAMNIIS